MYVMASPVTAKEWGLGVEARRAEADGGNSFSREGSCATISSWTIWKWKTKMVRALGVPLHRLECVVEEKQSLPSPLS